MRHPVPQTQTQPRTPAGQEPFSCPCYPESSAVGQPCSWQPYLTRLNFLFMHFSDSRSLNYLGLGVIQWAGHWQRIWLTLQFNNKYICKFWPLLLFLLIPTDASPHNLYLVTPQLSRVRPTYDSINFKMRCDFLSRPQRARERRRGSGKTIRRAAH